MSAHSSVGILERLAAASGRPLHYQCSVVEDILATSTTQDLREAFPHLLHEIFDFDKEVTKGWQLDRVYRKVHPELFDKLRRLLGPEGSLMNLVNSLHADPLAVYQFPFKCLPAPSRQMLEEGVVPSFYANKLQGHSFSSPVITLNAFELLMFHFAHALVSNNWQARNQGWSDLYDFVYPRLIDDYLNYLLPCDKTALPSVPFASNVARPPIGSISPSRQMVHGTGGSPGGSARSLFKSSFLQAQKQHQQTVPVLDQAETEIYRSETFLQVITEFWLNQNSLSGNEVISLAGGLPEHFLPTMNQVKVVRLLVKYLHYFANSATAVVASPYQTVIPSPLDQFKRSVIPHIMQKKLYSFLRHAFDRWPLDSCFGMVLETWLSYIQPWRYVDFSRRLTPELANADSEQSKRVDDKWVEFVSDNLLFYTVLTSELLPRIQRMDLTSPYSAYMVYRVSRILNLPNLANIIFRAEQDFLGPASQFDHGGSYLSSPALHMSAVAPQSQLMELEGPNFSYIPFFVGAMKYHMMRIVEQMTESLDLVRKRHAAAENDRKTAKKVGFLASLFGGGSCSSSQYDTSPEQKRLPGHLEQSIVNFCTVFSLPKPSGVTCDLTLNNSVINESVYLAEEEGGTPECVQTDHGLKLTDAGRRQLLNRERKFDKFDVGDPDLLPVRSYESTTLVRVLFHLCVFINSYFSEEMVTLYLRSDWTGHFARVFLTPPTSMQQNRVLSPRTHHAKLVSSGRPHISLRFLASYPLLIQLGLAYLLLTLLFGLSLISLAVLVSVATLGYGCARGTYSYLTQSSSTVS